MEKRQPMGIELVKRGIVTESDIEKALDYQKTHTNKKIGDIINIETDCIGKYIEKLIPGHGGGVSREVLLRNGFI